MKKILSVFILFAAFRSVGFSDEMIGSRLRWAVKNSQTDTYVFRITDIYQENWEYYFVIAKNADNLYEIYAYAGTLKVGAADINSLDFQNLIFEYITSTSSKGHPEWREYAATIAGKIALYIQRYHRT